MKHESKHLEKKVSALYFMPTALDLTNGKLKKMLQFTLQFKVKCCVAENSFAPHFCCLTLLLKYNTQVFLTVRQIRLHTTSIKCTASRRLA